jgi:hypothetical protein
MKQQAVLIFEESIKSKTTRKNYQDQFGGFTTKDKMT